MDIQKGAMVSEKKNTQSLLKMDVEAHSMNNLLSPIQALTDDMVERIDIAKDLINQMFRETGRTTWGGLGFQTRMQIWDLTYQEAELIQRKLNELGAKPWKKWDMEFRMEFRSRVYMEKVKALEESGQQV